MTPKECVRRKERLAAFFLLTLAIVNAVNVAYLAPKLRRGYQDFTAFYCGGLMIRSGEAHRLYDLGRQYQVQLQFAPHVDIRQMALPYNHPPFEALLFIPLTYLSFVPAYLVWGLLNVIMLAGSVVLLRKTFSEVAMFDGWFLVLAVAAFPAVATALMHGQDSILLTLLATAGLILLERNHDGAAGIAFAGCAFKFQVSLPLTLIIALRRPRLLLGFFPAGIGLVVISAAIVGWQGVIEYVGYVLKLEKSGAGGAIPAAGMPNLHGLIASLTPRSRGAGAMWLTLGASFVLVCVAAWLVTKVDISAKVLFEVGVISSLLVSYHALIHDLTLLLPVVLLLFGSTLSRTQKEVRRDVSFLVILYISLWASAYWQQISPVACLLAGVWILAKWKIAAHRVAVRA